MQESNEVQNNKSNNQSMGNDDSTLSWHLLSLITWIFFIITIWASYHNQYTIWSPFNTFNLFDYMPLQIDIPWLQLYIFFISLVGFVFYLIFTTYKKNQNIIEGMLGNWSKYHFIPLLFIASLYIISQSCRDYDYNGFENGLKKLKTLLIFNLIFTIIGFISLIVIYILTKLNSEWYIVMAIKKGVYSTFIILLWYNFFVTIIHLKKINIYLKAYKDTSKAEEYVNNLKNFFKNAGISFTIIFGLGSLIFSVVFKDLMAAFTNFLLYLGMVISFFNKNKSQRAERKESFNGWADGVLDIIYMALSFACIVFLIFWCKHKIF